jgi:hypothetical protein
LSIGYSEYFVLSYTLFFEVDLTTGLGKELGGMVDLTTGLGKELGGIMTVDNVNQTR